MYSSEWAQLPDTGGSAIREAVGYFYDLQKDCPPLYGPLRRTVSDHRDAFLRSSVECALNRRGAAQKGAPHTVEIHASKTLQGYRALERGKGRKKLTCSKICGDFCRRVRSPYGTGIRAINKLCVRFARDVGPSRVYTSVSGTHESFREETVTGRLMRPRYGRPCAESERKSPRCSEDGRSGAIVRQSSPSDPPIAVVRVGGWCDRYGQSVVD
ncbi:uncharacterized protein LOC143151672 [Ptiloglossa arizonensis]|uniref:uncharacterized protein LOC143151672 n=1 Tax=Ptiloglossa arizonensis TaxID=3350558 RepID=UPI003F9F3E60